MEGEADIPLHRQMKERLSPHPERNVAFAGEDVMNKPLLRIRPPGMRIQLTLWFIAVFSVLILLFGAVFYINLRASLQTNFDSSLQLRTQQIAAGINEDRGTITIHDVTGALPGLTDPDAATDTATPTSNPQTPNTTTANPANPEKTSADVNLGALVRILNIRGDVVYVTPAFLALNIPPASVSQPLHGNTWQGTVTAKNGQTVRLYSTALAENGIDYGVVQVGESLAPLGNTLQSVAIELLIIVPFVLILGTLGSYWLAAHAFAPIDRLTRSARNIEAGDLHERVPVPRSKDEIQSLALTFNEMIERIDKAFTRQRRFVADASHELRTPVAAIRSMTDVVLAHNTPIESEEYAMVLREVNAEAERLGNLINGLLLLARSDENQVLFEHELVRLDLLASDVAATVELLATERSITLEVVAKQSTVVMGDEVRLIQVIMNLLDNAVTYSNRGGKVKLEVKTEHNKAFLIVSDTGIGIAKNHLDHIFERFYRVDPARSRAAGSTGLGLAIVDWIVRAHNGSITVESEVGVGTTFTVVLPIAVQTSV
jgi:two-component system, OmpR family, sensor kinase